MLNHKSLATGGLFPGLVDHLTVATFGGFSIDVQLTLQGGGGGGRFFGYYEPGSSSKITIIIRKDGKEWKQTRTVSILTGKSLEKIITLLKCVNTIKTSVALKYKKVMQSVIRINILNQNRRGT